MLTDASRERGTASFGPPALYCCLMLTDPADPRHGKTNGYSKHKCRCDRCKEAHRLDLRKYWERHPEAWERHKARRREYYDDFGR